ncbi:MAG: CheR family methyltransferase [Candidatus Sulfotelmatobacter sp.]
MTKKISEDQLLRLSDFVARYFGLHFPEERWFDLQRAVYGAAQECGYQQDIDRYVQELLLPALSQRQLEVLASYLTVGETYFFREKRSLEVLERDIVPELIQTRKDRAIRIWSAGCATGEEPYSIAILLSKLMAGLEKWDVEILATDLNFKSLQKASEGIYGEWSFRGTPPRVRSAYFEAVDKDRWAIRPAIKKMVTFAQFNLVDNSFPWHSNSRHSNSIHGFDVIFCRNVLMYFTPEGINKVVRQLYRSLASNGWLIVSPTETSHELFSEFAAVNFGDVTLYRKSAADSRKTVTLPSVVYDENGSGSHLPEQRFKSSELAMAPVCTTAQKSQDHGIDSENAEPHVPSFGKPSAIHGAGRADDARQIIGTLPSQNGNDVQAMLLLARACADQGNLAAALIWCDKAIAADKMAARAYYLRATILQEQGTLPDAVFAFKQTVYVEPQFVLGHFSLGNLALKHGRLSESEKHFENVLLLLAQYDPEDIVPESEGLSVGTLRDMIVSRRAGMAPGIPEAEVPQCTFRRAGKPRAQQVGIR